MRLFIDNLDGQGPVDYSPWVLRSGPIEIVRTWNEPSVCSASLFADGAAPVQRGRVLVLGDDDSTLFTGFVQSAAADANGVLRLHAVSDELIADDAGARVSWSSLGDGVAATVQRVVSEQGAGMLSAPLVSDARSLGVVAEGNPVACSANLGAIARAARSTYNAAGLMVSVSPVGTVVHDGANVIRTAWKPERAGANDICISGEVEPAAYVTECFTGDGSTASFELLHAPFREAQSALVDDAFAAPEFSAVWDEHDGGGWISAGGAGLVLSGGNGTHGVTYLQRVASVEMGGALQAEAYGVSLNGACDGVLCGFYDGGEGLANCVAGVRIRQSSGVTIAAAMVNGAETGSAMALAEGHRYTFRVRVFADEARRVKQVFRVGVAGTETVFGGGTIASAGRVVMDVQDLGLASSAGATVLCDAAVSSLPATAKFVAVESAQMFGSVRGVKLRRGFAEVRKRTAMGVGVPVLLGAKGEGVDASLAAGGLLTFFDGRLPDAGDMVTVRYRVGGRAVARCEDSAVIAAGDAVGLPGRVQWEGHMVQPAARSSEDCEAAAAALLAVAGDAGAGRAGMCEVLRYGAAADVWPGDAVQDANGLLTVRAVTVRDGQTEPESARYEVHVANEWAQPLSVVAWEGLADGVERLQTAYDAAHPPLECLSQLQVVAVSETAIQIDAGVDAAGGGFEVRRWDAGFGATVTGADADLVLRSPVRGFDVVREAQVEMYAVRMYDGSTPRRYSRFSTMVRVDAPMA